MYLRAGKNIYAVKKSILCKVDEGEHERAQKTKEEERQTERAEESRGLIGGYDMG